MPHKADQFIKKANEIFQSLERRNVEPLWRDLLEYMLNHQFSFGAANVTAQTGLQDYKGSAAGAKTTNNIFDSTSLQAVQDLAAAFQGTLTNPATTWSRLRFRSDELNDDEQAVHWLEEVNEIMHNKFNESNFNTEIAKGYQSLVAIGNMPMFHEVKESEDGTFDGFRFTSLHVGRVAWAENKDGIVDTLYRKFDYTAKQAAEKWGDRISDEIMKALEETPDKKFEFLHCIVPRDEKDIQLNELGLAPGDKRPVASVYIDICSNEVVEETGYYEFPVYAARWSLMAGERYGRGPGHLALPDVRTLNRLKMRGLEAIDLQVRPPIFANQRDVFGQLDLRPGGISIVKNHDGVREFVSQARSDVLQFSVEELRQSIRSIFFLDKLLLPPRTETGEMTAFEISQRVEQMQRVLGPTLSRLNSELLQPLVIRAFKILLRSSTLPEMPAILQEQGIDIEIVFVNQLARSQQIQDVTTIQQWVQNVGNLAQIDPSVVDNINADGIARHMARILGVPEEAVQSRRVIEETRQARAQQQQQAAALEQANMAADTASKASNLDT